MKSLVIIPSYNTGPRLLQTVHEALRHWQPVWVVIDGSDDGSDLALARELDGSSNLRILRMPGNRGKGAAILAAARVAKEEGYTHICTLDADGQHECSDIPRMMAAAEAAPGSFIVGTPILGSEDPAECMRRSRGGNALARIETLYAGLEHFHFGYRVYPIKPFLAVMRRRLGGRRYDFETEVAVRLIWKGLCPVQVATSIHKFAPEEGGVCHFQRGRDNMLLTCMHLRLLVGMLPYIPRLLRQRRLWQQPRSLGQLNVVEDRSRVRSIVQ